MATPSRPSTASARLRNKTSELSDLFRGRQHSTPPSSSSDPSTKVKRKIPLFSLRKKSPAAPDAQRCPTPPLPTPSSSTNPCVALPSCCLPFFSKLSLSNFRLGHLPWRLRTVKHSLRNLLSRDPPSRHCPHLMTRLPLNVPQLHL
jgi:hypothetical protein